MNIINKISKSTVLIRRNFGSQLPQIDRIRLRNETYDPIEYESFKFEKEKEKYYAGYDITDIYGKNLYMEHSPKVKKDISTDNLVMVLFFIITVYFVIEKKNRVYKFRDAYNNYRNGKLTHTINN